MLGIGSVFNKTRWVAIALLGLAAGCSLTQTDQAVRSLQIQQNWELKTGDTVAGYPIAGSLGDVSIELNGASVYAPFDGQLQRNDIDGCFIYSSPEVPAYLFRLCGLRSARLGDVVQGQVMGRGQFLQFAALRRQPDGTWALVEPASDILQRTLSRP